MKGRFPVCCLFLEINPALVDVNIHPAKREVKFHNERIVQQFVAQAVRETLLKFHSGRDAPAPVKILSPTSASEAVSPMLPAMQGQPAISTAPAPAPQFPFVLRAAPVAPAPGRIPAPVSLQPQTPEPTSAPTSALTATAEPTPLLNVPLRLAGVIGK